MKNQLRLALLIVVQCVMAFVYRYHVSQDDFISILSLYTFCSASSLGIIYILSRIDLKLKHYIILALLPRLLIIGSDTKLSDDYYRYYWDAMVLDEGISPYLLTPKEYKIDLNKSPHTTNQDVYGSLNSKDYYSIYPPLSQAFFFTAYKASFGNPNYFRTILQVIFLLFDLGLLWLLARLINRSELRYLAFYAFSPFVLYEFVGNLHFDLIMVFFLALSLLKMKEGNALLSAFSLAFAVAIKPQALIFSPFILLGFGFFHDRMKFALSAAALSPLFYLPIVFSGLAPWLDSFQLYFSNFEFNPSIYLLVRELVYLKLGYNAIASIGPIMAMTAFFVLSIIGVRALISSYNGFERLTLEQFMIMAFTIYLLFSTTVHPWYILPILILGIKLKKLWAILWSILICFSYSFYDPVFVNHHVWISMTAYLLVLLCFFLEKKTSFLRIVK